MILDCKHNTHDLQDKKCKVCWLYRNHPDYRRIMKERRKSSKPRLDKGKPQTKT